MVYVIIVHIIIYERERERKREKEREREREKERERGVCLIKIQQVTCKTKNIYFNRDDIILRIYDLFSKDM